MHAYTRIYATFGVIWGIKREGTYRMRHIRPIILNMHLTLVLGNVIQIRKWGSVGGPFKRMYRS